MTKAITSFDKNSLKAFGNDMRKAMEDVAKRYGVETRYKGGQYSRDGGEFTPKFDFIVKAENSSDGLTKSARDYLKNCELRGLKSEWLNVPIVDHRANKVEIVGWNSSRPKNCVALSVNGKTGSMCGTEYIMQFADKFDKAAEKKHHD